MSTVAQTERLLTAEEFSAMPDELRTELVKGRIVDVPPPGFLHGRVQIRIGRLLDEFAEKHRLGHVLTESGTVTQRDPDTVRGPDVSFYSFERVPKEQSPDGYPDASPEVIFEVLSPKQGLKALLPKAGEYLAAGTLFVCLVDPRRHNAVVYKDDDSVSIFTEDDTLQLPSPLADWSPRVGDFFPA